MKFLPRHFSTYNYSLLNFHIFQNQVEPIKIFNSKVTSIFFVMCRCSLVRSQIRRPCSIPQRGWTFHYTFSVFVNTSNLNELSVFIPSVKSIESQILLLCNYYYYYILLPIKRLRSYRLVTVCWTSPLHNSTKFLGDGIQWV